MDWTSQLVLQIVLNKTRHIVILARIWNGCVIIKHVLIGQISGAVLIPVLTAYRVWSIIIPIGDCVLWVCGAVFQPFVQIFVRVILNALIWPTLSRIYGPIALCALLFQIEDLSMQIFKRFKILHEWLFKFSFWYILKQFWCWKDGIFEMAACVSSSFQMSLFGSFAVCHALILQKSGLVLISGVVGSFV